jgi:hypothetical protein
VKRNWEAQRISAASANADVPLPKGRRISPSPAEPDEDIEMCNDEKYESDDNNESDEKILGNEEEIETEENENEMDD